MIAEVNGKITKFILQICRYAKVYSLQNFTHVEKTNETLSLTDKQLPILKFKPKIMSEISRM